MPTRATLLDLLVPELPGGERLDVGGLFGAGGPGGVGGALHVEIGCGSGGFLVSAAATMPEVRWLGVEWAAGYARKTAHRLARRGLTHARVLRADAGEVLRRLGEASVACLYMYHPDPWPKKRHWKRRLVQDRFVREVGRVLEPGALWWVQTDHAGYYEWILERLGPAEREGWLERHAVTEGAWQWPAAPEVTVKGRKPAEAEAGVAEVGGAGAEAILQTNFERKALAGGIQIHRAVWRRTVLKQPGEP